MTIPLDAVKEALQELIDNFTQLAEEAEKRRKTAGSKSEYYKFEFADGEKNAYQEAIKKLRTVLDKNLQAASIASL
jgi:thiamine pyrophosphate-dependent acetolactate synthase large subunit-like protein